MKTPLDIKIFSAVDHLPENWDTLAVNNVFLSKDYFKILERSAPDNMSCFYIGLYKNEALVGISLSQFLNLNMLKEFGDRDNKLKKLIRNKVIKKLSSHLLIIGNYMLTGQNAFAMSDDIEKQSVITALGSAAEKLQRIIKEKGYKVHLTIFKDYFFEEQSFFEIQKFKKFKLLSAQPNMVFQVLNNWHSKEHYVESLSKKYRNQYHRARKKMLGVERRIFEVEDIIKYSEAINRLYRGVATNAGFNTFFLKSNHFQIFKEIFREKITIYGYFQDKKLVAFCSIISNNKTADTYFLGYDVEIQKEKMLYLNMLYDMVEFSVNKQFSTINFARTSLEIKSSIGAKPINMFGVAKHHDLLINKVFAKVYTCLTPKYNWTERNPFKE